MGLLSRRGLKDLIVSDSFSVESDYPGEDRGFSVTALPLEAAMAIENAVGAVIVKGFGVTNETAYQIVNALAEQGLVLTWKET